MEESIFHYIFKAAWHNVPEVPVYGKGGNFLPTIHIMDLAAYGYEYYVTRFFFYFFGI